MRLATILLAVVVRVTLGLKLKHSPPANLHSRRAWFPAAAGVAILPAAAAASSDRSRTTGYQVQRTEREWQYVLSGAQYNILRQGGTERPNSSILVKEKREGVSPFPLLGFEVRMMVGLKPNWDTHP